MYPHIHNTNTQITNTYMRTQHTRTHTHTQLSCLFRTHLSGSSSVYSRCISFWCCRGCILVYLWKSMCVFVSKTTLHAPLDHHHRPLLPPTRYSTTRARINSRARTHTHSLRTHSHTAHKHSRSTHKHNTNKHTAWWCSG